MTNFAKLAIAAAAIVLVAVVGLRFLARPFNRTGSYGVTFTEPDAGAHARRRRPLQRPRRFQLRLRSQIAAAHFLPGPMSPIRFQSRTVR